MQLAERPNLSVELAATVRQMIVDGRLEAGTRLNEVHVAASLNVSRTPLREALGRLEAEGSLRGVPRIGWFVCPLTVEEFEQIYPIRAILDPEALRLSGIPSEERLERLDSLGRKILASRNVEKTISLDDAWHLELLAGCPNRVLIDLIQQFMGRTRRYEIAYMREQRNLRDTGDAHEAILRALRARDLGRACKALEKNLRMGMKPILAWLHSRGE